MDTATNSVKSVMLDVDRAIYNWISEVYGLIVKVANYEIFDASNISAISRKIYALLGIFMLFKVTFSMISYIVNPDEFSDKSKGFSGLIKNVIMSMVLIVAMPYIFSEAFYIQRTILEDGTLIKVVFSSDNGLDRSDTAYVTKGAGEKIKFALFSQFVRPNRSISDIRANCNSLYETDANGKRLRKADSEYAYQFSTSCQNKLEELAGSDDKKNAIGFYIDGMEYESFDILANHDDIYKLTTSAEFENTDGKSKSGEVYIIEYRWFLSMLIGIITLLALITICMDIALRTIKLAFYQIIAPIPIISNCDPKASKDGMFKKWSKACISTYLDLFIRLLMFFFAIFIIQKFLDTGLKQDNTAVVVFIIIGALFFAKQAPKIIEEATGLKIDKFTLNPFKKLKENIPEGLGKSLEKTKQRVTGAAGGLVAGFIGGGNKFGQKMLSSAMGTVKGAAKGKGFVAGLNAQADTNRKMRDARIAGATFWGGVGAAIGSTFGADNWDLEKQQLEVTNRKRAAQAENDAHDIIKRRNDSRVTSLDTQTANLQRRKKREKEVFDGGSAVKSNLASDIKGNKAGYTSRKLEQIRSDAKTLSEMREHGTVFDKDKYVWVANENPANGNLKMEKMLIKAGNEITPEMVKAAEAATSLFENKDGLAEYGDVSFHMRNGEKAKMVYDSDTGIWEYAKKLVADPNDPSKLIEVIDYEAMSTDEQTKFNKDRAEFVNLVDQQEIRLEQHNKEYGVSSSYKTTDKVKDIIDDKGTAEEIEVNEAAKVDYKVKIDSYAQFKDELDAQEALVTSFDTSMIRVNNRKDIINDNTKQDLENRKIDGQSLSEYNNITEEKEKEIKRELERRKPNYDAANSARH